MALYFLLALPAGLLGEEGGWEQPCSGDGHHGSSYDSLQTENDRFPVGKIACLDLSLSLSFWSSLNLEILSLEEVFSSLVMTDKKNASIHLCIPCGLDCTIILAAFSMQSFIHTVKP